MKTIALLLLSVCLLAGCVSASNHDFVQGWIRITPPVQFDMTPSIPAADGGTLCFSFVDAKGRKFDYYIDHRLSSKTPGAIYLRDYPGRWRSVRVHNEAKFREVLGMK
jgi:hypothetical protein